MMPLVLAEIGKEQSILTVGGKAKTRAFLGELGFVPGNSVTVISENAGNLIVKVKDSRVAIDKELAAKILV
ncbi:MAG: ferrous iron transport protein A [Sphaerochaeta sp.]|jgi:ferrous iron transport protein A|nr:ferrous iron transport protein A [Sphaerochaeta sp.]MCH3919772.1 ferrous iron transport protein A [Sphaerochaeta sp.]MCI2045436.1 ferrous iron transport protein A [Sphaerochaeta sp.]MCI2076754.1 ferrous iron transport protein A [Sphaerochaeta sp.]MCI2096665.1 ferrous iron transport protein A [Sphaerochaeta sp.]